MTAESRYPDAKARRIADAAVDELSLDDPMSLYIATWEIAYVEAGGRVVL